MMFRDTSEELARLEAELLAEEEPAEPIEDEYWEDTAPEDEYEEDLADTEDPEPPRYRVYNTDTTDEDLDSYAEAVRQPQRPGCAVGLVLVFCLLTLSILALLALILRRGGFL